MGYSSTIGIINPGKGKKFPAQALTFETLEPYPKPANPEVWIPYKLGKSADVSISIYDTKGQLIRILDIGHRAIGAYMDKDQAAYWNGRNKAGEQVSSGLYFCIIRAGEFAAMRKMII